MIDDEHHSMKKLIVEFNSVLLGRMRACMITHEDVVSALLNLLAHHALKLGWSRETLLDWVQTSYATHAADCGLESTVSEPIDAIIARSSCGKAARLMKTDPEAELQRIDDELTPEAMAVIVAANTQPLAWVGELASEWEQTAARWRGDHEHYDGEEECEPSCNAEAKQVERCAAELRKRAKEMGHG